MLQIEMRLLDRIRPYPGNPRVNDHAVDAVAASIREYGWRAPIVVDGEGVIVCGHTRLKAARKLGLSEAPVHVARDLTPEQVRAYRLADNRSAENADWDYDLLPMELSALRNADYDLSLIGFSGEELSRYLAPDEQTAGADGADPDEEPEPPVNPISKRGEVYRLGSHRLVCGDNGSAEDMAKLAGGERFDLCFTSPPYMQQRDYGAAKNKVQDWDGLMRAAFAHLPMKDDGQILVNLGLVHIDKEWQPYWRDWIEAMRAAGWLRFGLYIWHQDDGMPAAAEGRRPEAGSRRMTMAALSIPATASTPRSPGRNVQPPVRQREQGAGPHGRGQPGSQALRLQLRGGVFRRPARRQRRQREHPGPPPCSRHVRKAASAPPAGQQKTGKAVQQRPGPETPPSHRSRIAPQTRKIAGSRPRHRNAAENASMNTASGQARSVHSGRQCANPAPTAACNHEPTSSTHQRGRNSSTEARGRADAVFTLPGVRRGVRGGRATWSGFRQIPNRTRGRGSNRERLPRSPRAAYGRADRN